MMLRSSTRQSSKLAVLECLKSRIPMECIGIVLAKNPPKIKLEIHKNLHEL